MLALMRVTIATFQKTRAMNYQPLKYVVKRFILRRESLIAPTSHFGLQFHVKTEDVIGRHLYKYGEHDPELTAFLKSTLVFEDGDVVLDIGANVGWYSLLLSRLAGARSIDIFAFEPDPTNFALLHDNIGRNQARHVTAVEHAVADTPGTRPLYQFRESNRGRHSLLAINHGNTVDVETVTVDGFWEAMELGVRVPRFMKIDIEGFELMALRGASRVLERCPKVLLEYAPAYMRAGSLEPSELVDLMLGHGFTPHELRAGRLEPMDAVALRESDRQLDIFWSR